MSWQEWLCFVANCFCVTDPFISSGNMGNERTATMKFSGLNISYKVMLLI